MTKVLHDLTTGRWRVVCDIHGQLASYRKFWDASYDCQSHRANCDPPPGSEASEDRCKGPQGG